MSGMQRISDPEDANARLNAALEAIKFQTSILTLNAAIEAARLPAPAVSPSHEPELAVQFADPSLDRTAEPLQAPGGAGVPSKSARSWRSSLSSPPSGPAHSEDAAGWQASLVRLQQSLSAELANPHHETDAPAKQQPLRLRDSASVPEQSRRRRRPPHSQEDSDHPFEQSA